MERYNFVEAFNDLSKLYEEVNKKEIKEAFGDKEETAVVTVDDIKDVEPEVASEVEEASCVDKTANEVMAAYQNANKWLDSVKEAIYTKMSCPFFSSFVHALAHTMPARFDAFGDILHTVNMEIPYPATAEIAKKPATVQESFDIIFSCLDAIKAALNEFIKCTDEQYHGMACAAEACLNDIEGEYPMLYRLRDKANECGEDTVTFDKFVGQYQEHKDDLLEGLNEGSVRAVKDSGIDFTDTVGNTFHYNLIGNPDETLTSYTITDGVDEVSKEGILARQALREIIDFIKSHLQNRKNISLVWNIDEDDHGDGDCVVSLYSKDERHGGKFGYRTIANWPDAERMIRNALHLHNYN